MPADPPATPSTSLPAPTRTGYVALVGLPNAGKSTLLNQLVGEHLSIVTSKPQTTWQRVTGIRTEAGSQMIFLDTPGLLEARDLMQRAMLAAAVEALAEADVVLVVVDASEPPGAEERERLLAVLSGTGAPVLVALNKTDDATEEGVEGLEAWLSERLPNARCVGVSALEGEGVEELGRAVVAALPEGPFLYPEDEIASDPVRFFVAELVRETIFEQYHQEIPYSTFCQVSELRENQDPVYVGVDIHVERRSQKGIVIGKGGRAIRDLGAAARAKIEHFLGQRVYLDLWVRPLESWRKSRAQLSRLGFRLPPEDDTPS